MIEHVIVDKIAANDAIREYCKGNIFTTSVPNGTYTPYIVVSASDNINEDVIAEFDVTIDIYDLNEDKRALRKVSRSIKNILHRSIFDDEYYGNIRVWFKDRQVIRESESTLSRINMSFNVRASELIVDEN